MGCQDDLSKTYVCNQVQDSGKKQLNKHISLQGLRCEWGAGVSLILVTGSSTWHLMAKNSEDLKKRYVALRAAAIR